MDTLPHYSEFSCELKNKAAKWTKYVNSLKNYFTAYNIEDDKRQKAILLTFVGEEKNDLIDQLPSEQTTPGENETHFDKLVLAEQNDSNSENNTEYSQFVFRKKTKHHKQRGLLSGIKRGSSYVPLHRCKCGNKISASNRLFIRKICQEGLMNANMLFGDLINYAKTTKHLEEMHLEDSNSTTKSTTSINALVNKVTYEQQRSWKRLQQNRCKYCNWKYPHEQGLTSCPAFQNQCAYCQRWGHFTSVCFRKLNDKDTQRRTNRPTSLNQSTTGELN